MSAIRAPSGHVFRVEQSHGSTWYASYRPLGGRPVVRRLGPSWTQRGPVPAGCFTKRSAEDWLRNKLDDGRPAMSPGPVTTGATVAAAAAWRPGLTTRDESPVGSTSGIARSASAHLGLMQGFLRRAMKAWGLR